MQKKGVLIEDYIKQEINKHIGAIEALSVMLRNLEQPKEGVNEQVEKTEDAPGAAGTTDPATTGNGYAHEEARAADPESV